MQPRTTLLLALALVTGIAIGLVTGYALFGSHAMTKKTETNTSIANVSAETLKTCLRLYPELEKQIQLTREKILLNKTLVLPASMCKEIVVKVDHLGILVLDFNWEYAPPMKILVEPSLSSEYRMTIDFNPFGLNMPPYSMPVEKGVYVVKICSKAHYNAAIQLLISLRY